MKKISKFNFDKQTEIRSGKEFQEVSEMCVCVSNDLQKLHIKQIALGAILKYQNIVLADKLGYADLSDYNDFYREVGGYVEYIEAYISDPDCSVSNASILRIILDKLYSISEDLEIEEKE